MNIKQILNTAVGGYSLSKILSALVTLLGQWIVQSGQRSVTVEYGDAKVTVKGRVATNTRTRGNTPPGASTI